MKPMITACPTCGDEDFDCDANYCGKCKTDLRPYRFVCWSCGNAFLPASEVLFCPHCAAPEVPSGHGGEMPEYARLSSQKRTGRIKYLCCGADLPLAPNDLPLTPNNFCPHCGKNVRENGVEVDARGLGEFIAETLTEAGVPVKKVYSF